MNQFTYAEDKINFNEDNFYTLLKQNKVINSNIPPNNSEFDYMIRNISYIKSDEYNNVYVPQKPYWKEKKYEIKLKIENVCEKFLKELIKNKSFKQEIKYDMKKLDEEINALNLFNNINKNKNDEIRELIENKKNETKQLILIETNSLSDLSIIMKLKIQEGKEIMNKKLNNLGTKDLNKEDLKSILIQEVLLYPRFMDIFFNKPDIYNKIINDFQKEAEEIAVNYINKKNIEKKKELEISNLINKFKKEAEEAAQKRIELENKFKQPPAPQPQPACFSIPNYNGGSIVDALKSIGVNSTLNYRRSIADRNGIGGGDYRGRPHENIYMLKLLKEGRLIIP